MEKLEQVTGGNYGGSSGNWVSARVKASGGLYRFSKSGSKFSNTGRIFVPCGEYITVDKGRAQGVYVIAFYNDQEGWVDSRGLEWLSSRRLPDS